MFAASSYRFDEVRVQSSPTQWTTLTPAQFHKIPLVERIQLIAARKLRFLLAGIEISPVEALKD
jgi:hypothetical protein